MFQNLYRNPVESFKFADPSRKQLAEDALILDIEYRGSGVGIDEANLDSKVNSPLNSDRLKTHALYIPCVRKVIDAESKTYIRPPVRYWTKNGKPVSTKVMDRINQIYEQMSFDQSMLAFERQTAREGTLLVSPRLDEENQMYLVKQAPSNPKMDVTVSATRPDKAMEVTYQYRPFKDTTVTVTWDALTVTTTVKVKGQDAVTTIEEHGHEALPWATLRFVQDSSRFWGPADGGLVSLCKTRSLLLADSVMRTQTSLFDLLVMSGFSREEAISMTKNISSGGRILQYDNKLDDEGKPLPRDIKHVNPPTNEPTVIFMLWESIYRNFLSMRGHALKNFEGGSAMVSSAETQMNAMIAVNDEIRSRRPALARFEKDLWRKIVVEANKDETAITIPDGIELDIDWSPDEVIYQNTGEKLAYYEFMLAQNLLTPAQIMRRENPDVSVEFAEEQIEANKVINTGTTPDTE